MYVYLQAYQQGASAQPLVAFVSLYREQAKFFETQPVEMSKGRRIVCKPCLSVSTSRCSSCRRANINARYPCLTQRVRRLLLAAQVMVVP